MSKNRAKKLRKRAREAAAQDGMLLEEGGAGPAWYSNKGETCEKNFLCLKLEVLGPFLFGQATLSSRALTIARDKNLLPSGSTMLPIFFDRPQWDLVQKIVSVICSTINLCESNSTFCGYLMSPTKATQDDGSLSKLVQLHNDQLKPYSITDILPVFQVFRAHATEFTSRANGSDPGSLFFDSLADKDKLIAPVKDRGNMNFKQQRFRAAIADYTTALRLCAVLYCNRALCYLKNEDNWSSCLDSYRALVLKPTWEKPYYRCAESLCKLGDLDAAFKLNSRGRDESQTKADLERQLTELEQLSKYMSSDTRGEGAFPDKVREIRKHSGTTDDIDASSGSTAAEVRSGSKPAKKSKVESKEKSKDIKPTKTSESSKGGKSSEKSGGSKNSEKSGGNKSSEKSGGSKSTSHKGSSSTSSADSAIKRDEPVTRLEILQYPVLDSKISIHQLRHLSNVVKLRNCSPSSYLSHSSEWESYEQAYKEPAKPKTDPLSVHKPLPTVFDEIWCPVIADVKDSDEIIPPTFTYIHNGGPIKQTLPTLVTCPIRKDSLMPYD